MQQTTWYAAYATLQGKGVDVLAEGESETAGETKPSPLNN